MKNLIKYNRFLIPRRVVQFGILLLFFGANYFGWKILSGNYSSALLLDKIHLSDPYASLQILTTGFMISSGVLSGALIILLFYGIVGGRMFCSWVCPMNIITDSAAWLKKKLNISSMAGPNTNRKLRYWILALSLILSAIFGIAAFELISPISMLHRSIIFGIGMEWAIILAIFIFDAFILKDGWCGHLCPLGAFYALAGRYRILKVKHTKEKCTKCMKCFEICPEEQVLSIVTKESGFIKSGECNNCGQCIEVCDDKALKFDLTIKKNNN